MMDRIDRLLLQSIRAALADVPYDLPAAINNKDLECLLRKADHHAVLPFVYESIMASMENQNLKSDLIEQYRKDALSSVMLQIEKTSRFLQLYQEFRSYGLKPLVVKGLFCRHLYSKPSYRSSVDEDILIAGQDYQSLNILLISKGFEYPMDYQDTDSAYEVLYIRNPEYYEVHKCLFDPDDDIFKGFNKYFEDAHSQTISFEIDGIKLLTLDPTRHMLFLILHVFKHFLFSGFGIRQICDITLLANRYGCEIDWDYVIGACHDLHAYDFMCAVFKISEKHLILDRISSHIPIEVLDNDVDEGILLDDVLNAGIMGGGDINRLHSSNITLHAVRNKEVGNTRSNFKPEINDLKRTLSRARRLIAALFPAYSLIKSRFSYLEKYPFLLPIAWLHRMFNYINDLRKYKQDNPFKALEIGEARTEILKKYHII